MPRQPGWRLMRPLDPAERGEVWLAEHAKTREQRVYKFSFDGSRLYALKREVTISRLLRQSLGERPEFVHVSGWDFAEAPYFIQSQYGGPRLEEWAQDQGGLDAVPLKERIELIANIAEAVATAHDVGVLHKDLKPANLLVNGSPGQWQPRLVDFGSGRVLEPERLEALGISRLGLTGNPLEDADSLTGTLLYLAPELLAGQVPTVRSDIYALGILLYQMCVGDFRRPMSSGWEEEIDDAMLREDIAAAANGNPDLRFASARELAQRLRNREQRAWQREQERAAAQRAAINERALAAARARRPWMLASMCALAIGCVVAWYMYRVAAEANTRAVREMQVAQAVNDFLNRDLLATANPVHGGRANITLLEAINRAEPAIETRFANDPQVAATIHQTLGDAYYQLADYAQVSGQYARAATLFALAGDDAPVLVAIAQGRELQALALSGNRNDAQQRLEALWPQMMRIAATSPMVHVEAHQTRGMLALAAMRYAEAVPSLQEALNALEAMPHADVHAVNALRQNLNWAGNMIAPLPEHAETQQFVIAELGKEEGEEALKVLQARQQLAGIQVQSGKGHEMEQAYINLVNDYSRIMGPDSDYTLRATVGLVNVYTKLAQWDDCERHARAAWDGFTRRLGPEHPHALNAANLLAVAQIRRGHLEEAQALLEAGAAHLQTKDDNLSQIFLAAFRMNLAHLRLAQERFDEARTLLAQVQAHAPDMIKADPDFSGELNYLEGRVLLAQGKETAARERIEAGLALLRERNREEYWVIQEALGVMAAR